jgi:type IV secretory pathway VirB4 component
MNVEQKESVQHWLPIETILNNGIIKMKNSSYIKILKVSPINYNLKSDFDKEAIINSYKSLFKSINFNFQILIQSKKEDLSNNIECLRKNNYYEEIKEKYINYINELNNISKSANKNFFLIIKHTAEVESKENILKNLAQDYKEIKELLYRCGNIVSEITSEKELREILFSFLNSSII